MNAKFDELQCPTCQSEMRAINVVTGGYAEAVVTKKCTKDGCNQVVMLVVPAIGKELSVEIGPVKK